MSQPTAQTPPPNTITYSLDDLERDSWHQLVLATQHAKNHEDRSGFRTMTVATNTPDGADARTVVLRQVDAVRRYLWFHTDARASKVMQLEAFPKATLLFWDEKSQIQLRLSAETRLHTDDYVADEQWKNLWVGSRKMYLSEPAPGSEQLNPYPGFPPQLGSDLPSEADSEAGRKNFAVMECRILSLEYLQLGRSGQTRARFQYEPDRKLVWLAP
jgi:pyridoxamine 5'-phosphate oxidase